MELSGRNDFAEKGYDLAEKGNDLAEKGNDFAEKGNDFAEKGNDLAEKGKLPLQHPRLGHPRSIWQRHTPQTVRGTGLPHSGPMGSVG